VPDRIKPILKKKPPLMVTVLVAEEDIAVQVRTFQLTDSIKFCQIETRDRHGDGQVVSDIISHAA
jgi:hypothetical protein